MNRQIFRFTAVLCAASVILCHMRGAVSAFTDSQYDDSVPARHIRAGVFYDAYKFSRTNLFPEINVDESDKPFSGSTAGIRAGYISRQFKIDIIGGSASFLQGLSDVTTVIEGGGFFYGGRIQLADLPYIEYTKASGKITSETAPTASAEDEEEQTLFAIQSSTAAAPSDVIGRNTFIIGIQPKIIAFSWPENEWIRGIDISPGIEFQSHSFTVKESTYALHQITLGINIACAVYEKVYLSLAAQYGTRNYTNICVGLSYIFKEFLQ